MNQKGFGLKEFVIAVAIIFICFFIVMSLTKDVINEENNTQTEEATETTYEDLTKKLKNAAERYQNDNYSGNIDNTETWILSYSMLKAEGYLEEIYDISDSSLECSGYVVFVQDGMTITYTPYLKCGSNYITDGYDDTLDS